MARRSRDSVKHCKWCSYFSKQYKQFGKDRKSLLTFKCDLNLDEQQSVFMCYDFNKRIHVLTFQSVRFVSTALAVLAQGASDGELHAMVESLKAKNRRKQNEILRLQDEEQLLRREVGWRAWKQSSSIKVLESFTLVVRPPKFGSPRLEIYSLYERQHNIFPPFERTLFASRQKLNR